jgi:hypothetical protein
MNVPTAARILIDYIPFATRAETPYPWDGAGAWPCHWIACPGVQVPFVAAFALPCMAAVGVKCSACVIVNGI